MLYVAHYTKYKCIICNEALCNRQECSVPELNDDVDDWIAGKSVAYCRDCDVRPGYLNTVDESQEDGQEVEDPTRKDAKKNTGRSLWCSEHLDDMIDVIVNNENFKRKLIFTNNKRATNAEVYQQVLNHLKERQPSFPFRLSQIFLLLLYSPNSRLSQGRLLGFWFSNSFLPSSYLMLVRSSNLLSRNLTISSLVFPVLRFPLYLVL